ncbi:MAG: ATP-dependent Clp protease ATP-binding subunit [bacterium]
MKIQKTSKNLDETLRISVDIAKNYNCLVLDESILFAALLSLKESAAVRALQEFDIEIDSTIGNVLSAIKNNLSIAPTYDMSENTNRTMVISTMYKKILEDAYKVAMQMPAPYVGTEHLLIAWYEDVDNEIKENLVKKGIDHQALYVAIKNTVKYPVFFDDKNTNEKSGVLKMIGKNLTEMARKKMLDPVIGRDKEMDRLASILMRRTKNNPILIGDAGVGKTAIVEGFTQKIANGTAPYLFKDKTIWQIDSAVLFAGSPMRGDIENKLLALIDEVSNEKTSILFIDEIHTLISGAQGGGGDIANVLKPALARGQLRCIGATTYAEYVKYIESDPALARRFQPIFVDEIDAESAKIIVNKIKPMLEKHHHVSISEAIVEESIELSERYITERYLPDKVIDLLDEAASKINLKYVSVLDENIGVLQSLEEEQQRLIEVDDISGAAKIREAKREIEKLVNDIAAPKKAHSFMREGDLKDVISQWTGIPINSLTTADVKKIKNLPSILSESVIGQKKAVDIVSDALQVAKVGISDEKKPMSSFLFAGPTGVGKTEMARQIAAVLFGSKDYLVQLDMSEFMEAHSVSKLIGSPPGYIGFDTGGQLTEKIRKRPYSVVLFDEIEKAHPDVLNILLQILEEGKLTDNKGRIANFKNTIIVMTTNLGAEAIANNEILGLKVKASKEDSEKEAYVEMEKKVMEELKKHLLPELINRIDHIVIFKSLTKKDIEEISRLQLLELVNRIKKIKKIQVSFTDSLKKYIAKEGYDEEYGARNIKRKVNELIESKISKYLLSRQKAVKVINLDYKDSEVVVNS